MADRLERYREKRDPRATPEPPGDDVPASGASDAPRFVVQEHHARALHWDLRLEHDGVLASWAVPRGIPPGPERNHLAVRTEDHPMEYLEFHGEIPAGQYGAGTMKIWDTGTYEEHKFRDDEVMVTFHGERVRGRYVLFRTRDDQWMIHRMDPADDPDREPMPERLDPMLARTGPLPREDGGWAYEIKWDGVRAIAFVQGGRLKLQARSGRDITPRYPELRPLAEALAATRRSSTARSWRSTARARASRSSRAACTSPPTTRSGGWRARTRCTTSPSTCSTSTAARCSTCATRSAAPRSPSSSCRARRGRRPRTTSATAPRCWS